MKEYYISSTKFTVQTRKTKNNGTMYDAVFRIIEKDTGKRIQKSVSGKTKAEVKYKHDEFVTEHCEIVKNASQIVDRSKQDKQPDVLFTDALRAYFESCENQTKDSSIVARKSRMQNHVLPCFEGKRMSEITSSDLYEWQDNFWRKKKPDGTYFANEYLRSVRGTFFTFMEWYCSRNDLPNPFRKVKAPKKRAKKAEMQFWTREEFEQFISVVDDPTYKCLFYTLFFTGRRIGEVVALAPSDVTSTSIRFNKTYTNKTRDGKRFNITTTKADKAGSTPICPTLKKALSHYSPEDNASFFFGGSDPIPMQTIRHRFAKYTELSGVKPIRIHDLRHSFASMLIHEGANLMVVADLIGDTVEQVMKTYGHLYESDKISLLSRL